MTTGTALPNRKATMNRAASLGGIVLVFYFALVVSVSVTWLMFQPDQR